MFNKLKQFKDLRSQAKKLQEILSQEVVNADWKGKINIVMDGRQTILSIDINPELLDPEKKEELEKGIKECHQEAIKKSQMAAARKMQEMGGLSGFNPSGL